MNPMHSPRQPQNPAAWLSSANSATTFTTAVLFAMSLALIPSIAMASRTASFSNSYPPSQQERAAVQLADRQSETDQEVNPEKDSLTAPSSDDEAPATLTQSARQPLTTTLDQLKQYDSDVGISDNGTRIANNFLTLANNSWPDLAMGAAALVGSIVLWCILFGVGGLLASILVYSLLLWRGWASFKWKYFWLVGWIIPVLFMVCFTAGFAYSGAFYGARRYCVQAIEEDQLIEKTSVTMYCALVMDNAEYQANGDETISDLVSVIESSDEHQMEFNDEFQDLLKDSLSAKLGETEDRTWYETLLLNLGASLVDERIGEWSKENAIDIRVLVAAFMNREEAEAKFGAVTVNNVVAASAPLFDHSHTLALSWADTVLQPNIILGIFVGIIIPSLSLVALHLLVGLIGWMIPNRNAPPPPPTLPPMPRQSGAAGTPVPPVKPTVPSPPTK